MGSPFKGRQKRLLIRIWLNRWNDKNLRRSNSFNKDGAQLVHRQRYLSIRRFYSDRYQLFCRLTGLCQLKLVAMILSRLIFSSINSDSALPMHFRTLSRKLQLNRGNWYNLTAGKIGKLKFRKVVFHPNLSCYVICISWLIPLLVGYSGKRIYTGRILGYIIIM